MVINGQDAVIITKDTIVDKMVMGSLHTVKKSKRTSFSSTNSLDSAGPDPIHPMSTGRSKF